MTLEGVPWMVAGAEHSADVGRLLAYGATGPGQGIIGPDDFAVLQSSIADNNINIARGALAVLNRDSAQQSYLVRNIAPEVVALTAQGSSGTRYDLIAIVVEDPQYPGYATPTNPLNGPYVKAKVYENVPSSTTRLEQVAPNQTGYGLALVTRPASSNTVTQGQIKDLRKLVKPRAESHQRMFNVPTNTPVAMGAERVFPTNASWSLDIPTWATVVQLKATIAGVSMSNNGDPNALGVGTCHVSLGSLRSQGTNWYADGSGGRQTQVLMDADEIAVPANMRGTSQLLHALCAQVSNTGVSAFEAGGTAICIEARFFEAPGVPLS